MLGCLAGVSAVAATPGPYRIPIAVEPVEVQSGAVSPLAWDILLRTALSNELARSGRYLVVGTPPALDPGNASNGPAYVLRGSVVGCAPRGAMPTRIGQIGVACILGLHSATGGVAIAIREFRTFNPLSRDATNVQAVAMDLVARMAVEARQFVDERTTAATLRCAVLPGPRDGRFRIAAGSDLGLAIGDVFRIETAGGPLRDPDTGRDLGAEPPVRIAAARVVEVSAGESVCEVTTGDRAIEAGMLAVSEKSAVVP